MGKHGRWPNKTTDFATSSLVNKNCHPRFIAIAPRTYSEPLTREATNLLNYANKEFNTLSSPPFVFFKSQSELEAWIQRNDYDYSGKKISSAIIVNEGYPNWDFTFRFNRTQRSLVRRFRMPRTYDPKFDTSLKNNEDEMDGGGGGPPMRSF